MLILTIRTDKPEAEIGLFDDNKKVAYEVWQAHRRLAETIHSKINDLLQNRDLRQVDGIVCFGGPGSFTGLRIGLAVGNALAYSLSLPIVATGGDNWQKDGIKRLLSGQNQKVALPEYGAPANITKPKK